MPSLHLLQPSLVYVNTLIIQQILAEPAWQNRLNTDDLEELRRCSMLTVTLTAASTSISDPGYPSIHPA
jgi:hypothetical protein